MHFFVNSLYYAVKFLSIEKMKFFIAALINFIIFNIFLYTTISMIFPIYLWKNKQTEASYEQKIDHNRNTDPDFRQSYNKMYGVF